MDTSSSFVDTRPVPNFLATRREEPTPKELQYFFYDFEEFWERKLWHQLTNSLEEFFNNPKSAPQRLDVFQNFVLTFADKINQLKLVEMGLAASQECDGIHPSAIQQLFITGLLTAASRLQLLPCLPRKAHQEGQQPRVSRRLRLRHRRGCTHQAVSTGSGGSTHSSG